MPVTIVVQLLALHLLLTVPHELGHLVAARLVGVSVPEFGIGLPPTVIAARWRGTRWSINLLPLGAFVGYNATEARPSLRRSAIAVAGPIANFLVAFACLIVIVASGLSNPFDLGEQVVRHLTNGLADPFGGDEVFSLVGLTAPQLVKHLSQWDGVTEFLRVALAASVVVGLFNLLPLPSLDGHKLLVAAMRSVGHAADLERWAVRACLAGFSVLAVAGLALSLGGSS
jgi:membrane-associated protease RseP (regulator of RpoE activity)